MKTATLTIKVPDDFEKDHCGKCPVIDYCADYDIFPCPLEIQEVRTPEVVADIGWSKYDGC